MAGLKYRDFTFRGAPVMPWFCRAYNFSQDIIVELWVVLSRQYRWIELVCARYLQGFKVFSNWWFRPSVSSNRYCLICVLMAFIFHITRKMSCGITSQSSILQTCEASRSLSQPETNGTSATKVPGSTSISWAPSSLGDSNLILC